MSFIKILLGGIALAFSLVITAQADVGADLSQRAALQAAMQQHIDRNLIDGAYLHLNRETGEVERLYPLKAHPVIMRMGDHFVLCSDFSDAAGGSVNVDFYIARDGESYVIFASAVDDRAMLQRWIGEGKVQSLD